MGQDQEILASKIRQAMPGWRAITYDVVDMTAGIEVISPSKIKFDVKILKNDDEVLIDFDRNLFVSLFAEIKAFLKMEKVKYPAQELPPERFELIEFLKTEFKTVTFRLLP